MTATSFEQRRAQMVEHQILGRGIDAPLVVAAMGRVPREDYVAPRLGALAYDDTPLPIGEDQTISQPYVVALMLEALSLAPGEKVLEVGTGSGYAAAVLAEMGCRVYSVERHRELAEQARQRLRQAGYDNASVRHGDGTEGWPEAAPFGAIVVAAGGREIPEPLLDQLAVGGRLVMPVEVGTGSQKLLRVVRESASRYREEELCDVRFVPLVSSRTSKQR